MKLEHSINALSRVSFTTRKAINPATGEPSGVEIDNWAAISHSAAKGLDELQRRLDRLESTVGKLFDEGKVIEMLEVAATMAEENKRKKRVPDGVPIGQVLRRKREKEEREA